MVNDRPPQPSPPLRLYMRWVAIVGLLILAGSCIVLIVRPGWTLKAQAGAGLGIVLLLLAVLLRPHTIHKAVVGRSVKYGSGAVVMSAALIGILILLNFLAVKSNREFDLTETRKYTLSEQTVKFLEGLDESVQVIVFFRANDHRRRLAKDYLERYSQYTPQLTYAFYDPAVESTLAENYELSRYGLVFVNGLQRHETHIVDEYNITTGLMNVTGDDHTFKNKMFIASPTKMPTDRHFFLTPFQAGFTLLATVIAIPLAVLLAGVRVWWIRR